MTNEHMISKFSPKQDELFRTVSNLATEVICFEVEGTLFKGDKFTAALRFAYNNPTGGDFYVWLQDHYTIIKK